ncbi:helix-turn-helix domain-containing protein [Maribacter sp. 1_MG-2023]|uniref:helix-turn-helix domain-containing protein n=1 Tax=Maribacter sp. 1_MG-2023 TaxID=3062677 RepID=UPI0026E32267|nr:AraC family transcriptional regulator [Maribacter sp. 1_MG-2023]MDO6472638.1 AraC family transcriptional regulator [Maribacter sp. 1_MG-2023]
MKDKLHIYNCALFTGFFKNLEESGFCLKQINERYGLKNHLFKKDTFIPTATMHDVLQEVWVALGKRSFVAYYGRSLSIYDLIDFELLQDMVIDLETVLEIFVLKANEFKSNAKVEINITPQQLEITFNFPDNLCLGRRIAEQIWLIFLLDLIKEFRGDEWLPKALHVMSPSLESLRELELIEEYPILYGQSCYRLLLEPTYSSSSIENNITSLKNNHAENTIDTISSIEKILQSFEPNHRPRLVELSSLFKTSARSIKRHLEIERTTFSKVLSTSILKDALIMLCDNDTSIIEISEKLGYSDSSNFVRSFKRWTGLPPHTFKDTYFSLNHFSSRSLILD